MSVPLIDLSPLRQPAAATPDVETVARALDRACREHGFFQITGHGVAPALLAELGVQAHRFFGLPPAAKAEIAMAHGGRAWRGWFPLGGELTSGQPDRKEGLYFGTELAQDDPRVQAGWPLHGANLWPRQVPGLRPAVAAYMQAAAAAAGHVLEGLALALGLQRDWFAQHYTADPTVLFRIFRYPPAPPGDTGWGVGEHTDYGLLTVLAHDGTPGLQVRTAGGWIDVPSVPGALVCNIGDMLDRLTGGVWRSTPHRVRNAAGHARLSFPLFFDPGFQAEVVPLPGHDQAGAEAIAADRSDRWDGRSVLAPLAGTYGDYLLDKVGQVFPQLRQQVG